MTDKHDNPAPPQMYLLSEPSYKQLTYLQNLLTLFAHLALNQGDKPDDKITTTRASMHVLFKEMSTQLSAVLDLVKLYTQINENGTQP